MDAAVPITAPVAGIARALVMEGKDYAVLTDIRSAEDHYGDMDSKSSAQRGHYGAADGYQGAERDPRDPPRKRWNRRARRRLHILDIMVATIDKPRDPWSAVTRRASSP